MTKKRYIKVSAWILALAFLALNIVSIFHAYHFTHFRNTTTHKTASPTKLSKLQKVQTLLFGVSNPRPTHKATPQQPYKTIYLEGNKTTECWHITTPEAKGTVILFHGYGGSKSGLIGASDEFLKLGYNTLLVDFMGSGGSEGNQTTIGFYEAEQVKTCFDYLTQKGEQNIHLYGNSMGAVSILKAINDYSISPSSIIIGCPFGTMQETVGKRFDNMGVPRFPASYFLVFWGGVINNFWAFGHNPVDYAKAVQCPTLLLHGAKDDKVGVNEIHKIASNIKGKKKVKIYPEAGHSDYINQYREEWLEDIQTFLD